VKENSPFKELKLYLTGGYSSEDKRFVNVLSKEVSKHGFGNDIRIFKSFSKENRIEFLKSLTLLSVPVPTGEAFGSYLVEALAAGVPVVQPDVGCYPEFVEVTNGGVIYKPNTSDELANAIVTLLADPEKLKKLGEQGRKIVMEKFSMDQMAKNLAGIYDDVS
jgi:glycosyltransferase involved in cell wall biosynthesis